MKYQLAEVQLSEINKLIETTQAFVNSHVIQANNYIKQIFQLEDTAKIIRQKIEDSKSEDRGGDQPRPSLNPTASAPGRLSGSDREDAAKTQHAQPESVTPVDCKACGRNCEPWLIRGSSVCNTLRSA
jgi:hypothetical protein